MQVDIHPAGDDLKLYRDGLFLGRVQAGRNRFHGSQAHLKFKLDIYDNSGASLLFKALRTYLGAPLQVNLSSEESELVSFLIAGGFRRMRRCMEVSFGRQDLLPAKYPPCSLLHIFRNHGNHLGYSRKYYEYYRRTHEKVSPLTADFVDFYKELPDHLVISGDRLHFAYVEGGEIAYVCSDAPDYFDGFGYALATQIFENEEIVSFECDDCDEAAMALRRLFVYKEDKCWDTYVFK